MQAFFECTNGQGLEIHSTTLCQPQPANENKDQPRPSAICRTNDGMPERMNGNQHIIVRKPIKPQTCDYQIFMVYSSRKQSLLHLLVSK